jgi:tyrosyl-tRNA synthetase
MEEMTLSRPEKYGGDMIISGYSQLKEVFESGQLHPADLKNATSQYLVDILKPVRDYFEKNPANYEQVTKIEVTR